MPDNETPVLEPGEELAPVDAVVSEPEAQPAEVIPEAAPEEPLVKEPPKKSRGGFQARIDRLTREKYESEARVRELQEQLESTKPKTADMPERAQYESYEDYIRAVAAHEAKEAFLSASKEQNEAYQTSLYQAEEHKLIQNWEERKETARDKYEDYDEVTDVNVPVSQAMMRAILESEAGTDIAYYLGKNPAEAERILQLSTARQFIEIGKLELKVQAPKKLTSGAPAPINALKGSGGVDTITPDDKDDKKWLAWRNKQLGRQ